MVSVRFARSEILQVDPSGFNDPVAEKTEWKPCNLGGSNFCSYKLAETGSNKMEFRVTGGVLVLYSFILLAGAGILYLAISKYSGIVPVLIGAAFVLSGLCCLVFGDKPIAFDKVSGFSYKGRKDPDEYSGKNTVRLDQIHAIQLISKIVKGKKLYYCYELNFVFHDGTRRNILSHGNEIRIKEDAQSLASFLNIPVWDATA